MELRLETNHEAPFLRTGTVARICRVAPRTVTQWCNKGLLKHYKIPASVDEKDDYEHRRILLDDLVDFLVAHNMPLYELAKHRFNRKVFLAGLSEAEEIEIKCEPELAHAEVSIYHTAWQMSMSFFTDGLPRVIVLDFSLVGYNQTFHLAKEIKAINDKIAIIGIYPEDADDSITRRLAANWFDNLFRRPINRAAVTIAAAQELEKRIYSGTSAPKLNGRVGSLQQGNRVEV